IGDIADIDRLETRMPAPDQRQDREHLRHAREPVEEVILRPEYDGGTEDRRGGKADTDGRFTSSLAAGIGSLRLQIGTQSGNVKEALDPQPGGNARKTLGALPVHGIKALPALLIEDADQVDN